MDPLDDPLLLDSETLIAAEEQATARLLDGFQKWAGTIFAGIVTAGVMDILARVNNPSLRVPIVDATIDVMRDSGYMGVDVARQQLELAGLAGSVEWEAINTSVLQWVLNYNYQLIGGLTETTKQRLIVELARFVTSGESLRSLIERLSDRDMGLFSKQRAQRIAATEVTRAYYQGNIAAWLASGSVKQIQWRTAVDEIVCPTCRPMHNVITELGMPFQHPTLGEIQPPAHVNCRCGAVPYIDVVVPDGWRPQFTVARVY